MLCVRGGKLKRDAVSKLFFNLEDVVVWQGAITKYGVIKELVDFNDPDVDIRKANAEEIARYKKRPEK